MRSAADAETAAEIVMGDAEGDDHKGSTGVVRKGRGHGGERALLEGPLSSSSNTRRRTAKVSADVAMEDDEFGNHIRREDVVNGHL
ncbi:hypothetical protein Pmar_PMAR004519 [Perkinsus marinus ATCC 50983]|uniref:Uncharacterized protein n=1 Tax=Perkinsus marinus (strain ATCC 50983 / TXsc) TaxID=423536 RepID=C5LZW2_PERM5|nr:hypothetical protein Pmar_PMAR004519 [Perkinsus marinus ATCC 50983]EEQ97780.1 hypothetical protein Pmar_PMAR004519 [Perkinsus marinus ATCC 50983]|eukprot:XP_002765063.1 hypothetical protein Pmar_PMAR004519 [Perkinsus marinus ATCC 50983]